ncbi:hypothetical protein [Streptomyces sp. 372A]
MRYLVAVGIDADRELGLRRREEGQRPQAAHRRGHPRAAADGAGHAACITDRDAGTTMLERLRQQHWRITLVWADSVYPDRSAVPGKLWRMLFSKAINDIGVLLQLDRIGWSAVARS